MAMIGDLEDFGFSELLQILGRGEKSGQLSVWSPSGVCHIWFYQGRVVAATPPGEQPNLQQRLSISPELQKTCGGSSERVVGKLATLCCPINQPLGACLRKQSLITSAGLAMVFRQQLREGVYALFELSAGQFSFNAKAPIPYGEMTGLSKECLDVAIEGLRQVEKRKQVQELPREEACFCRISDDLPLVRLSPLEWSVWEQVSPRKRLSQMALELETDLLSIRQTCSRLLQAGLIQEAIDMPESSPSPSAQRSSAHLEELVPASTGDGSGPDKVNPTLLNRLASALRSIQNTRRQDYARSSR